MAIIPSTNYAGQITTSDAAYPHGKAKNVTVAGDGTGTPLEAAWVNDLWGFLQALVARAGITPNGSPDEVGASQYLDALGVMLGTNTRNQKRFGHQLIGAPDSGQVWSPGSQIRSASWADDGASFFALGVTSLYQYYVSTPFSLDEVPALASYDFIEPLTEVGAPRAVKWMPNGTRFYVFDQTNTELHQYDCVSSYNLVTVNYDDVWSLPSVGSTIYDVALSHDGTKLVLVTTSGQLFDYNLSTAWDVTGTITANGSINLSTLTGWGTARWAAFGPTSETLFVGLGGGGLVIELFLSTPGVANTARPVSTYSGAIRTYWIGNGHPGNIGGGHAPTWEPEGGYLVFPSGADAGAPVDVRQLNTSIITQL